jgi:hypothetical protein
MRVFNKGLELMKITNFGSVTSLKLYGTIWYLRTVLVALERQENLSQKPIPLDMNRLLTLGAEALTVWLA